ncbi:MAG TPA: HAD-IIB family hydrolase [Gemmatimonadaceae bacterium]|nr:HAD-IIB family hydrolase [Gemmatimonadaceae bacterium]
MATDLDGTFLGGSESDRLALYRAVRDTPDVRLAFATGRGVESVLPLLSDPLVPDPEFIIADVGATIVHGDGLRPVQPLQWEIDKRWVGVEPVTRALDGVPGLERQPVPQERRCSFILDDASYLPEITSRLMPLECDVLFSAGRYLDVLPRGVSKGATLRRLVEHLGISPDAVLVAGDTLNDQSLFTQGFRGVVVGEAEAALRRATAELPDVLHVDAPGAGGILEAVRTLEGASYFEQPEEDMVSGDAQLVVVYHRLPFEERMVNGRVVQRPHSSPNGIVPTLLGCFEGGRRGSWVAWSTAREASAASTASDVAPGAAAPGGAAPAAAAPPPSELVDASRFPNLLAARVPLSARDVERFYKKFSKEAFWPVIFSFVDRASFSAADWQHFLDINRMFAERTAGEADDGALVWIHDYNLWMVPAFLRQLRPDLRIGFFHHTSFPPADVFNVIPWAGQVVGSLAQCDYVGFHIPRYVANFVDVLQSHVPTDVLETVPCAPRFRVHGVALALSEMPSRVRVRNRTVGLGAHPVGVNVRAIRDILGTDEAQRRYARVRARFAGTALILSVERLDYVKGPLQKLEAFERLLETYPELRGAVTLLMVTTPPAPGMEVYGEIREAVDAVVGRINGRFGTLDWAPVHYLFRTLPFEEVVTYSAAADVAWITPLRDGLNLVAKEYVVAQRAVNGAGVLVLSEFAGAAVEMHGALLTNPYDLEGLREGLYQALQLPEEERRQRIRRLARVVERHDVTAWSRGFLRAMARGASPSPAAAE